MAASVGYLLDTNILIALIRGNSFGQALDRTFGLRTAINRCMICIVTAGEMMSLARQFGWGPGKCDTLRALLDEIVWIDIDHDEILNAYGEIDHLSWSTGIKMGKNDIWIAATAKVSKATLLTTDRDFDHLHGTQIQRIWVDPATKPDPN